MIEAMYLLCGALFGWGVARRVLVYADERGGPHSEDYGFAVFAWIWCLFFWPLGLVGLAMYQVLRA